MPKKNAIVVQLKNEIADYFYLTIEKGFSKWR